jgi:hypothetical protein
MNGFQQLIATSEHALDQVDMTIQGFTQATRLADARKIPIGRCLTAMGEGATSTGDRIMLKVVGSIAGLITSWGVLLLLGFGIYQAVQAAESTWAKLLEVGKAAFDLFAHPLETIAGWFGAGKKSDGEIKLAVETAATLAASAVPEFGVIYGLLSRTMSPKKDVVGGSVHDHLNFGAVPVRGTNFTQVDEEEDHEDEIRDYGVDVAKAALAAGADPDVFRDALRDVLAGSVMHDGLDDAAEDVIDDAEDEAATLVHH